MSCTDAMLCVAVIRIIYLLAQMSKISKTPWLKVAAKVLHGTDLAALSIVKGRMKMTDRPLQIMIGYDPRETVTWHVLAHSILARASIPITITPISLQTLQGIYTRPRNPGQSTDFTFARFLTPYLAGPGAISIFLDSDMLCLCDVKELVLMAKEDPYSDVLVVKHDYSPKKENKFLNQTQSEYPCKNWSSMMIFNGHRNACRNLTPEYVNSASPMDLHQFRWAADVGAIPVEYNHLVGEYKHNPHARIVHYTLGAPCFRMYQNCEYSREWFDELGKMTHCDDPLMENYGADLSGHSDAGSRHNQPHGLQQPDQDRDPGDDPGL